MKIVVESMNIIKGTKIVQKLNSANFTSVISSKYFFFGDAQKIVNEFAADLKFLLTRPGRQMKKKVKGNPCLHELFQSNPFATYS